MIQNFDIFNQAEKPTLTLCNPDKTQLFSLDLAEDVQIKFRYNGVSELTFYFPESLLTDDEIENFEVYDYILGKRLILVENIGYFMITEPDIISDGIKNVKKVSAISIEKRMDDKKITVFGGTLKFYDPITSDGTLIQYVLDLMPSWSVGTIDTDLWDKHRTFEVQDSTLYNFLITTVSETYGCVFVFDYLNETISAYLVENIATTTDIFISYDNLIKNSSMKEITEEISTCLFVYGAGDLDVRTVNPLGTSAIYDFSYFKTINWMTQDLIDAITDWEDAVDVAQPTYAGLLTDLKTNNEDLIVLQGELSDLDAEYLALEGVVKVRIESSLDYSDVNILLVAKQAEIDTKQGEIDSVESTISVIESDLESINTSISFNNNFTEEQLLILDNFIIENTYQNENYVQTDIMTPDEVQDMAQELYDQAQDVLAKVSVPRYEFSIETANFMFLEEFQPFIDQLELGSIVTIKINDDSALIEAVLLEMVLNYDRLDSLDLTFSNRLRLDNGSYIYSDLMGTAVKAGTSVSFDSIKWANWDSEYKNDVSSFITSALDTSVNNVINAENQEILINQNGLQGQRYDTLTETYDPEKVWLTSNILAFTDDNWDTAKAALGKIDLPGGGTGYGLVAEVVIGNLLAGNSLTIENEGNNFLLDSTGAYLNNASFVISNSKNVITLDPDVGIKITTDVGGTPEDQFYLDTEGNVIFSGNLSAASGDFSGTIEAESGEIGGWTIASDGLSDSFGNYINSDGNIKLGLLTITPSSATFQGNIYADKIFGQVVDSQISDVNAGKVNAGTMSGYRVFGGAIGWPGVTLGTGGTGVSMLTASSGINLLAGSASFGMSGSIATLSASGIQLDASGNLNLNGGSSIRYNGGVGQTRFVYIGSGYPDVRLQFTSGGLVGFAYI